MVKISRRDAINQTRRRMYFKNVPSKPCGALPATGRHAPARKGRCARRCRMPPAARRALFCFYIYWDAVSPATVPLPGQFLPARVRAGAVRGGAALRRGVGCAACASSPSRMDGSCAPIRPSVRRNLNTRYRDAASLAAVPYPARSSRAGAGLLCGGGLRVAAFEDGLQLRRHPPVGQAELEHQIPGRSIPRCSPLPGQFSRAGAGWSCTGRGCSAARRSVARPARRRLQGWIAAAPPSARRSGGT